MNEILTAREVALDLRCSKAHVYKLMNGEVKDRTILPHIALGRKKVVGRVSRHGKPPTKLLPFHPIQKWKP